MSLGFLTKDTKLLCGHCGRSLTGPSGWGVGWRELPFVFLGELVDSGPGADVIKAGDILVLPMCSERCRQRYFKTAEKLGFEFAEGKGERILLPNLALDMAPSMPGALRIPLE
jgi:hypothetical protein